MSKQLKQRSEISNEFKWNISVMYENDEAWEKDFISVKELAPSYSQYSGRLGENSETLLNALKDSDKIWMLLERIYVFARMKRDEDNRIEKYQAMTDRCHGLMANVSAITSFFTPELLEVPEEKILDFIKENEKLKEYEFALLHTLRSKEHILSKPEENLLAQMSEVTPATNDIFTMLNNADIKFGEITDENGDKVTLTHGNYIKFMESKDRNVRKEAFEHMYASYISQINTLATTYNYNTKLDVVSSRIRKYPSSRAASLFSDNIPNEVYDNLISVVNDYLPVLHKYIDLRKKVMGVSELHMYDIYVPLIKVTDDFVSYDKAIEIMKEGLAPLGKDYISRIEKGLEEGWIDVYENEGKTSGAYSFGSYDSYPYVLLNYSEQLKDVFTLVHEMGHSMHSNYTREAQPYCYGSHSIFTAEVASTVNEALLMKYLLKKAEKDNDAEMKKYILNLYIEEFRTTLFRQTMFAEFEHLTHKAVESGTVLTAGYLCQEYGKLNAKYFGASCENDAEISYEWARIPHFYNSFYVYKYATGFSAASAISDKILNEGNIARDKYIEFLKTGDSNYPIELLKIAGVDMSSKEPIERAMKTFESLIEEFAKLV